MDDLAQRMIEAGAREEGEFRLAIAKAIHEGLGDGWAYTNYGGDEWRDCRDMLDNAANEVMKIVTPPAVVRGLVEALEDIEVISNQQDVRDLALHALAKAKEAGL